MDRNGLLFRISILASVILALTAFVLGFFREISATILGALLVSFVLSAIAALALGIALMTGSQIERTTQREAPLRVVRVLAQPWDKDRAPRRSRIVPIEPPDPDLVEISEQGAKLEGWITDRRLRSTHLAGNPRPPEKT